MSFTPEIVNDELWNAIRTLVIERQPKLMLEIGSATGKGSTTAFLAGIAESHNSNQELICFEIDKERYAELKCTLAPFKQKTCAFCRTTVPKEWYMTDEQIAKMMNDPLCPIRTKQYGLDTVIRWKHDELAKITENTAALHDYAGLADMVLIDGSAFTAESELLLLWGAQIIILDDVYDIKNWANYQRLLKSPTYRLYAENPNLRNGYAIFEKA